MSAKPHRTDSSELIEGLAALSEAFGRRGPRPGLKGPAGSAGLLGTLASVILGPPPSTGPCFLKPEDPKR